MPRTREELEAAAAEAERWLDDLDPAVLARPDARADDLRDISAALTELAEAERHLAAAVKAARAYGRSWGTIGIVLGVSKQAARSRFGGTDDAGKTFSFDLITPEEHDAKDISGRQAKLAKAPKSAVATGVTGPRPAGTRKRAPARD